MTKAAIQGDYVDLRFIKGRKVCQAVIEFPIEMGTSFVAAFGTPSPATGIPVAIARLDPNAQHERKGGKLAQRAGILCNEGAFAKFLYDIDVGLGPSVFGGEFDGKPDAALRYMCGVESRADLDHNDKAARKFLDLEASYKAWLSVPA